MEKTAFTIAGNSIPVGQETKLTLELPKLYSTPTYLPIRVISGKKSGPTVFICAAIHGDELNGIEIIRRLRKLKVLRKLRGRIILIPIVNIYGTMTLSRYLPDRRDLNRSFPGTPKGSLASRIANTFFQEIVRQCDFGIDLHTGALHKTNLPQIRTDINDSYTLKLAKAFEAPVIVHSQLRDGSLRAVAQEHNVPTLLYEAGEALRFDEKSIRIGLKGIINVLRENEMLPKKLHKEDIPKKKKKTPIITKSSRWVRSTRSGIVRTLKGLGDTVKKGEIIGYVDDLLEDSYFEMIAPFGGIIIGKSQIPLVQEGDAVFHIAKFNNLEVAENKIEYFSEGLMDECDYMEFYDEEIIE